MSLHIRRIKNYLRKRALPQMPSERGSWSDQVLAAQLVAAVEHRVERSLGGRLQAMPGQFPQMIRCK